MEALHGRDPDVQYYSGAALSNLAVNERHRAMMVAIGHYDVIKRLLSLIKSKHKKVFCLVFIGDRYIYIYMEAV